jgi:hypothetical protein
MKESEYNIDVKETDKLYDIIDEENTNLIINIFKGIITGFLIAYLIILGLRPAALYPDNILDVIDNPWIFVILIIVNFYVIQWDFTIGLLLPALNCDSTNFSLSFNSVIFSSLLVPIFLPNPLT